MFRCLSLHSGHAITPIQTDLCGVCQRPSALEVPTACTDFSFTAFRYPKFMIFAANTTFSALCFSDTCDVAVAALHNPLVEPFGVARQQGVRAIKIAHFRRENRLLTSGSISGVPAFDTFSYPRKKQVSSLQSPVSLRYFASFLPVAFQTPSISVFVQLVIIHLNIWIFRPADRFVDAFASSLGPARLEPKGRNILISIFKVPFPWALTYQPMHLIFRDHLR
jgi:hypothetical protein